MDERDIDVLIVGAGISGINVAYRLRERCPDLTVRIVEGRERLGGTWDLFRYPGIRSDSDMYTLAFPFRPWTGKDSIVDGEEIWRYLADSARELGLDLNRFRADMVSVEVDGQLAATARLAKELGFRGTPVFVVGRRVLPGRDHAAPSAARSGRSCR